MVGLSLIILTNILAAVITFITAKDTIIKEKKLQPSGWVLSILFLISIGLVIYQHIYTEIQNGKNEKTARQREEESNDRIIRTFTSSLAEYGLKYDSAQKIIERVIRDSAQRNITIIQENKPVFSLCTDQGIMKSPVGDTTIKFEFTFCYKNYPANVQADLYALEEMENGIKLHVVIKNFIRNRRGHEIDGASVMKDYHFKRNNKSRSFFFYIKGRYTDRSASDHFDIDNVYAYDLVSNQYGSCIDKFANEIKKMIREQYSQAEKVNF